MHSLGLNTYSIVRLHAYSNIAFLDMIHVPDVDKSVVMTLHCVIVNTVTLIHLTSKLTTACSEQMRLVLHVTGS